MFPFAISESYLLKINILKVQSHSLFVSLTYARDCERLETQTEESFAFWPIEDQREILAELEEHKL